MAGKKIAKKKTAKKSSDKKKLTKKKSAVKKEKKSSPRGRASARARPSPPPPPPPPPDKPKAPIRQRARFRLNEYIVYPSHGVGQIIEIKEHEIDSQKMEFFIIDFKQERMVLKVPVSKIASVGMRKLADQKALTAALAVLEEPARIKRTMWSRRAQEYESKINSGDLILLCEVVRDLYRSDQQREQSYSERQLYEEAFARLQREVAAARKIDAEAAAQVLLSILGHSSREALGGEGAEKLRPHSAPGA